MNNIAMLIRKIGVTARIFIVCFVFYLVCNIAKK